MLNSLLMDFYERDIRKLIEEIKFELPFGAGELFEEGVGVNEIPLN